MPTPRRRRKDFELPNQIVSAPTIAPPATSETPNLTANLSPEPTYDEIAQRAYQLYEHRGGEHGRDWDDWLQAERELRQQAVRGVIDRIQGTEGPYVAA